jgi:diguanylate cyclase (GGDEF)-like protein
MSYGDLLDLLEHVGKDPSRLIFEDELTGIHNRRFFLSYLEHKVRWDSGEDYPLSLLMVDLDSFKQINDTYGHDTGDQALTWFATVLAEIGGEHGLPIRYGGDEFLLLLPKADRKQAREMADRLLQRTRDRPFRLRDSGRSVPMNLSIGVATAPDDATSGKDLFQAADTALFHAKQTSRNCVASASEVDPEKVFPKTALYRLKAIGIAGRDGEMAAISEALRGLSEGHSEFLIVEGGPGMGKTAFLDAVRRNLVGDDTFCVGKVTGDPQEGYRPYYLISRLMVNLLGRREDRGRELLEELSEEELSHLARILPQLEGQRTSLLETDATAQRQGIFRTLTKLLPRVVDFRPLVLVIDDLHFADEATLLLLRVLIRTQKLTTLVCGSSLEFLKLSGEEEASPLERFYSAYHKELQIRRLKLQPLGEDGIAEYLRGVFPSLRTPEGFVGDLARITNGNPLFLGEILRKLVMDRKVTLVGRQWVIEPLEEGYLPRSLEEVVMEKIAALDEESRALLERASAFGEDIPLSVLAGSADLDESKVLEFLDRAEALGLVSLDFQMNDEVMRFLGKRILEISYRAIDQERRKGLHEEIGSYQESLYRQRLLPSASLLAYHFKRSANQEKARRYEQLQLVFNQTVFSPEEAAAYAGELLEDEVEAEPRLAPESIERVPYVLRSLTTAVRNTQLYPSESRRISQSLRAAQDALEEILAVNDHLHLAQAQRVLLVNGRRLDASRFTMLADSFLNLLTRSELQGIVFHRGVTPDEIRTLVTKLGKLRPEDIDAGFWRDFAAENGLEHIELRQVRYSRLRRRRGRAALREPAGDERELEPQELREVPRILRTLLGATQNAKLYPLKSKPVSHSLDQLRQALLSVLDRHPSLTLAAAGEFLLINGARIDTSGYAPLAANVLELMRYVGLESITFTSGVPRAELEVFVGGLRKPPDATADRDYWDRFAVENGLDHIALNQRRYAIGVVQSLLGPADAVAVQGAETEEEEETAPMAERMLEEPMGALREAVPAFGKELLVKGEHKLLRRLLRRLFENFQTQTPRDREKTVLACHTLFANLILGLQHKFSEICVDSLLAALSDETEPRVVQALAALLSDMAACAVHFADYQLASRILSKVKSRRREFEVSAGREDVVLARLLDRRLDPTVQRLLIDDLRSGQTQRQERAAQVIGSLGRPGIPMLIDTIKRERDFRIRQLAASLLAEMGSEAAAAVKRAAVTEVTVEGRFRILEVIDAVTTDLRDELAYNLGDGSAKIRRAAFRLFERLHDDALIEIIVPLARDPDIGVAKGAIRSLAHLRTPAAVKALVSILDATEQPRVAIACCQALGELGHASAIDALAAVLARRKPPLMRRRWGEQVRATAAVALKQIAHPRAAEVLADYVHDRDVRVRQLAESGPAVDVRHSGGREADV